MKPLILIFFSILTTEARTRAQFPGTINRSMTKINFLALALAASSAVHHIVASGHPRRFLKPKDIIADEVRNNRGGNGRFTIHTAIEGGATELAMDVVQPSNPAVDASTIIRDESGVDLGGEIVLETLLVTDVTTTDGARSFALLAINPLTDEVHGIVEKKGKNGEPKSYKIKQNNYENNGLATAQEEEVDLNAIPNFHCDVMEQDVGKVVNEREEERISEREDVDRKTRELRGNAHNVSLISCKQSILFFISQAHIFLLNPIQSSMITMVTIIMIMSMTTKLKSSLQWRASTDLYVVSR